MKLNTTNPSLVGVLVIGSFFLGLWFLPSVFTQRRFNFPIPSQSSSNSSLVKSSLPSSLRIIHGSHYLKSLGILKDRTSLNELLGTLKRPLLINFWATWCPPCVEEFPSIEFLNRKLVKEKSPNLLLITVAVDESAKDIRKFYSTLNFEPSVTVLHDLDGEISRAFGTSKFPETYLLSKEGEILHKWLGPQNWMSREVIGEISSLLGTK